MKIVQQRFALLTGVSMSVLGLAAPAQAATTVSPGISHIDTTDPVNDTLVICAIADDCTFGVDASGSGLVSAMVDNPSNGQIFQSGSATSADAVLNMQNEGNANIAAHAVATGAAAASASAILVRGIEQAADARGGDATAIIDNGGLLQIGASASASATGAARALGVVALGLEQVARGSDALASITNSGTLDMHAVANAKGAGGLATFTFSGVTYTYAVGASATAILTGGIVQSAGGQQNGTASLVNTGSISFGASAHASGPGFQTTLAGGTMTSAGPRAFAVAAGGLVQSEFTPRGDGSLLLDNQGTLSIGANAGATSTGVGPAFARAWAFGNVVQQAMGSTGLASAELDNSGTLTIGAVADALATDVGGAFASAQLLGGVGQQAMSAGTAAAQVDNSGSVAIVAQAHAVASGNHAQAVAGVTGAMVQFVQGQSLMSGSGATATTFVGDARATLNNAGSIQIAAVGVATGTGASGNGNIGTGVAQLGFAAGDVDLAVANGGLISISAGGTAHASQSAAFAGAGITVGLGQRAIAGGSAVADLSNAATVAINAAANAVAQTVDGNAAGTARAIARLGAVTFIGVHAAIDQQAIGSVASLDLTNSGSITLGAAAVATGSSAVAGANVIGGIRQQARGFGGDASVALDNSGTLAMAATGIAHATGGSANAVATIGGAVDQNVFAISGDALASFDNSGTLDLSAIAEASGTGDAFAFARANGVGQDVNAFALSSSAPAPSASALFTNSGEFDVTAFAKATGGTHPAATKSGGVDSASAIASADAFGAAQFAKNVSMANSGTMSVAVGAVANGANFVKAHANGRLSYQQAMNFSGDASASWTNDGTAALAVMASAQATVRSASATASVGGGLVQVVLASGDASASLTNSGALTIGGLARSRATAGFAAAHALISDAIQQDVTGGSAQAVLSNAGTMTISDAAVAVGEHALGAATVNMAIHQIADATGTGDASAAISNSGDLSIAVAGVARGDTGATAVANVYRGIGNYAVALGSGDAIASLTNAGDISVSASAAANVQAIAGTANAIGFISNAIQQTVSAQSGLASGNIDNSGTITIGAHAYASGVTTAPLAGDSGVNATAYAVNSFAIDQTGTAASGDVSLDFSNSGTIDISADAKAVATVGITGTAAGIAFATVYMHDPLYQHAYAPGGDIDMTASNDGTLDVSAVAAATGAIGIAQVQVEYALSQYASGAGGDAHVGFVNGGTINETAAAVGHGTAGYGFGLAALTSALFQLASAAGDASVQFTNSGTFSAHAIGAGYGGSAGGGAFLNEAIEQFALASGAGIATMANSGTIDLEAVAAASASTAHGTGIAFVSHGISQHAYAGTAANVALTNSGKITLAAGGSAVAATRAFGEAAVFDGIFQSASASAASVSFVNSGTLQVAASAHAEGSIARAIAVVAPAVVQQAWGGTAARATLDNSGTIDVSAVAEATGTVGAPVIADAVGVVQYAGSGTAEFLNSGDFHVLASGHAIATGRSAFVGVSAAGLIQFAGGGTDRFDNSGVFSVKAVANASGTGGFIGGSATGYALLGTAATLDISNSGKFIVDIEAAAPDQAFVGAYGMDMQVFGSFASGSSVPVEQALIGGTITNSGEIDVVAHALAGGDYTTVIGTGTNATTITLHQSFAAATAIRMDSGVNTASITNSGSIFVEAMTKDGGTAVANGILVTGNGSGAPATADDVFTFTNDGGTIIVRQSDDGGTSWHRGMAVDVSVAPNASVINLLGDGLIYGDIAVQAGDEINVADGTTYFDGIINPSFVPAGGLTTADLDSGLAGVGTLNIEDGGNLVLADARITGVASMYDGPAYAFVDTLNVSNGGTLTFELQPISGGVQPIGSYPQVFADTANLDGTLVADVTTANGLFADSYSWNNVIDANTRNGTFDQCVLGGPNAGSVLLALSCSYDSQANVDLALTRIAFNEVAGLNANGQAVGLGLECIYDVGLTGPVADMFADLFLFTDTAKYNTALNMLSGSVYANYLNSFPSLGVHYNDLTDHATDCEIPAVGGSVLECRASSPVHVWGQLDYQTRKADGDVEAGSTRSKRFTGLMGVDARVGDAAIVGVDAGYVSNHVRDHQFGDTAKGEGWQVGGYAVYDPGAFFVKGVTTYSSLNGDSNRTVDFNGLATGATFGGRLSGNPDVRMWTAGLHGGARFSMSASSVVTPYVDYDYVHAKLDGFTETGLPGANLSVEGGSSNHSFLTGGAKWAAQMGGLVPEVNLGYRYRFGDQRSDFRAFLNGDPDCDFAIESAAQKRGTFLAGLSVGGKVGPVDLRIGYEGEFNGDVTSHSGNFKIVLPLGGRKAAPAPAPVAAPPPPAPVVEQPAPPPPPPPAPAPVERGERGE